MRPLILLCMTALAACDARILAPGETSTTPPPPIITDTNPCDGALSVGSAPMRRLSHDEYRNSISDLQPAWASTVATQVQTFTPDTQSLGFNNGATFSPSTPPSPRSTWTLPKPSLRKR
jgi:hypothetical protein